MEAHSLLRVLWGRRVLVGIGLVVSIVVALKVVGGLSGSGAIAQARFLVDTPRSQLIEGHPALVETTPWRAGVLAKLLGTEKGRQRIADRAGVPLSELAVVDSQLVTPTVPGLLPNTAAEEAANVTEPYVLRVGTNADLPLISIKARAPEVDTAAALARAAGEALDQAIAAPGVPAAQAFVVEYVAPVEARVVGSGGTWTMAAAVALVLFGAWCVVLALMPPLRGPGRVIRARSAPRPAR